MSGMESSLSGLSGEALATWEVKPCADQIGLFKAEMMKICIDETKRVEAEAQGKGEKLERAWNQICKYFKQHSTLGDLTFIFFSFLSSSDELSW